MRDEDQDTKNGPGTSAKDRPSRAGIACRSSLAGRAKIAPASLPPISQQTWDEGAEHLAPRLGHRRDRTGDHRVHATPRQLHRERRTGHGHPRRPRHHLTEHREQCVHRHEGHARLAQCHHHRQSVYAKRSLGHWPDARRASHRPKAGKPETDNSDGGSIIANNIISDFGHGHAHWVWGDEHSPIKFDAGQDPDDPPLTDVVIQGNVVHCVGRRGTYMRSLSPADRKGQRACISPTTSSRREQPASRTRNCRRSPILLKPNVNASSSTPRLPSITRDDEMRSYQWRRGETGEVEV